MTEAGYGWLHMIGLGRAITHARHHGPAPFPHLIREACLPCRATGRFELL